jgi:ceroid-lipofuscinosis MFS transporter 7
MIFQVLLITSFIAYFNQTALETTLTPFTNQQFHWHELQVSILFAVAGIEITLVYICLHFLTKKCRDQSILLFGYILLSFACLIAVIILPFSEAGSHKYLPIFLIFVALDILALPLIVVTSTSLFTQQINNDEQGIGQGIQRFIISVATVVGPLYAGSLLQSTWIMLCSMLFIVLLGTILLVTIYRSFKSKHDEELSALIRPINTG